MDTFLDFKFTGVAQLVEHWSPKPGVGSSSLSTRAKLKHGVEKFILTGEGEFLYSVSKKKIMAKIGTYIQESADELLHKVSWPTWSELQSSGIVVLIASVIFALLIFLMDYTLGNNGDKAWFDGMMGIIYSLF